MNRMKVKQLRHGQGQAGFSMIEVLVTLLIISLALLGTAGLQVYAMRLNQGGQFRTQAVFLAADLAERIEANKPGAVAGNYAAATSSVPAAISTACIDAPCTPLELAGFDLLQWQNAIVAALPQGSWTVAHDGPANPITYTITIGWIDRQGDVTYAAPVGGSPTGISGTGERFFYTATRTIFN